MNVISPKLFIVIAWVSGGWDKESVGPAPDKLDTMHSTFWKWRHGDT